MILNFFKQHKLDKLALFFKNSINYEKLPYEINENGKFLNLKMRLKSKN